MGKVGAQSIGRMPITIRHSNTILVLIRVAEWIVILQNIGPNTNTITSQIIVSHSNGRYCATLVTFRMRMPNSQTVTPALHRASVHGRRGASVRPARDAGGGRQAGPGRRGAERAGYHAVAARAARWRLGPDVRHSHVACGLLGLADSVSRRAGVRLVLRRHTGTVCLSAAQAGWTTACSTTGG